MVDTNWHIYKNKGILAIDYQSSQVINPYDASILESMLNELSLAVENVTLLKQTRESMLQAERQLTHSNFVQDQFRMTYVHR